VEDPELEKIGREYDTATKKAESLRPKLHELIWKFKQANGETRGWQSQVVEWTGLTREAIRQIVAAEEKRRAAP
jgi:hypothetical protein